MNREIFDTLKNTYCRLKPSKISGVGVFAIRDISPKTELFKGQINQRWSRFKIKELKDLDKEIVINSMDVQWQNIMIDFVKLLKPLDANVR